jgi:hypothetical protein
MQRQGTSTLRIVGYVTAGVSLVALGVGIGFAAEASSKWNTARSDCPNDQCANPAGVASANTAGNDADFATGFLVGAGVGILATAALFIASTVQPSRGTGSVQIAPMVGAIDGLVVRGSL